MALGVLSGMTAEDQTVQAGDIAALTRLPGVGKKTAERLVVEMRDKLDKVIDMPADALAAAPGQAPASADQDAVSALIALGYKPPEASRMVSKVFEAGIRVGDSCLAGYRRFLPPGTRRRGNGNFFRIH